MVSGLIVLFLAILLLWSVSLALSEKENRIVFDWVSRWFSGWRSSVRGWLGLPVNNWPRSPAALVVQAKNGRVIGVFMANAEKEAHAMAVTYELMGISARVVPCYTDDSLRRIGM